MNAPRETIEITFDARAEVVVFERWAIEIDRDEWNRLEESQRLDRVSEMIADGDATYVKALESNTQERDVIPRSIQIHRRVS